MAVRTKRLARTTLIACVAVAAVPAAASAATVSVSGSTLTFNAVGHEANDVLVQKLTTGYRISEANHTLTVGAGCTSAGARQANCALGTINLVKLNLLDLNHTARVVGVVNTQAFGGPGSDLLTGGGGNDLLDAGSGQNERLVGNAGNDTLVAENAGGSLYLNGGTGNDVLTGGVEPS